MPITSFGVIAFTAVAAIAVVACSSPPRMPSAARTGTATTTATTAQPSPTTLKVTTTTIDPGLLPQTNVLPSAGTTQFSAEMAKLWQAVKTGNVAVARPAFFPESAYVRLKRIASPASDYVGRLLSGFDADIEAAHALLGAGASAAGLVKVMVPQENIHWVPPGACYNSSGYYEVANSRIVYAESGQLRSFGIASLISWRGTWYVVHLGAVVRSTGAGVVDDPSVGVGTSPYSSTC